ncbi:MAG: hypothetical protein JNM68_16530 [Dinghuibacter sp.]|nr:hypothetical protein [Dinghuibacter sp.]
MLTTRIIRNFFILCIIAAFITSCNRTMTPYDAANHGRMKKCRALR